MPARPWLYLECQGTEWRPAKSSLLQSTLAYPPCQLKLTRACLWIHGFLNSSWLGEDFFPAELAMASQAQTRNLCQYNEKADFNTATPFVALLKACAKEKNLSQGTQIHNDVLKRGLLARCADCRDYIHANSAENGRITKQTLLGYSTMLGTALVDMYAKCGALAKARKVLEDLPGRDVVSWCALITGYAQQGQAGEILDCFDQMQHEGLSPDPLTYACILKACGTLRAIDKGKQIQDEITKKGLLGKEDLVLGNVLVDMYAKCGALSRARQVLEELPKRDVVSWSSLISGYAQLGQGEQALHSLEQMQLEGISPNAVTYLSVLKACGSIGAVDKGEQIHDEIARRRLLGNDIALGSAVVDMYAKCGALTKAQRVLEELPARNIVSWTALIGGYAQQGQGEQALKCFEQMQCEGHAPTVVTLVCVLTACGAIGAVDQGERIHNVIARLGLLDSNTMLGNALVGMYAKCGAVAKAQRVLESLPVQDVVSWNALITGWVQLGEAEQAFTSLERMQRDGLTPSPVTFLCMLKACGNIGAVDKGEQIHDEITRQGLLENDTFLATAVVDMYAKCGALSKAQQILEDLPLQNVVSWNALITGYAQKGQGEKALNCFECMQAKGISPDAETFVCILKACGIVGGIEDAQLFFVNMKSKYGIKPDLEHYTCLLDVFGRAGHLDKAVRVIQRMPLSDNDNTLWSALLGACLKWGDVNVGRWAFEQALQVDRSDAAAYVLMTKIYAVAGRIEDAERIKSMKLMNDPL